MTAEDRVLPRPLAGRGVWTAADFPQPRAWVAELPPAAVRELEGSLRTVLAAGKRFDQVTRADFPLPSAAGLLAAAARELEAGRGFGVIGGVPVERYGYEEALVLYAGLTCHFGRLVDQSWAGAMKVDVADAGLPYGKANRGYLSSASLRFHTDGACLTSLLCLGEAAEGGEFVLVSAGAVMNAVLAERPDLYPVLATGFHHHRRGEHAPGDNPVSASPIPVFALRDGLLHCTYDRNQSLWAADEGVVVTPRQVEAMDFVDAVMGRPEMQLQMQMRLGDLQVVNNFSVLHARHAYRDGPGKRRHLVRYWIEPGESRYSGVTTRDLYTREAASGR